MTTQFEDRRALTTEDLEKEWREFFGTDNDAGFYEEHWAGSKSPEASVKEVEGLVKLLNLKPGMDVLDLCGGMGRLAIPLAQRGMNMTLLDYTPRHIALARKYAASVGVKVEAIEADARAIPIGKYYNAGFIAFTSALGYLRPEDDLAILNSWAQVMEDGALILIDTMSRDWLIQNYRPQAWQMLDDGRLVLRNRDFDHITSRNLEHIEVWKEGHLVETQTLDHKAFTPNEICEMLAATGFKPLEAFSNFDGTPYDHTNNHRVIVTARKEW